MSIPHKTFNLQFHAQAIRNPKHFRYKPVPKIEVPETRTDYSSTVRDPAQCLAHGLAEHFIILNPRLNDFSLGSRTRKSEFGRESYGILKLTQPIRKGVRKFGHTPVCHFARDFAVSEHSFRSWTVPKPCETGL